MRKTALKLGIFSLAIITVSTIFKFMHWPGAGIMIIVGYLGFCGGFQAAFMAYVSKGEFPPIVKLSRIASGLASVCLATGLLFGIQHWPGGTLMMIAGVILAVLAIAVFLLSLRAGKEAQEKNMVFTIISFVVIVLMSFLAYRSSNGRAKMQVEVEKYIDETRKTALLEKNFHALSDSIRSDSSLRVKYDVLFRETELLLDFIGNIKADIVSMTNNVPKDVADTLSPSSYQRWDDYVTPGLYMESGNSNGKGRDLLKRLLRYKNEVLQITGKFSIEIPGDRSEDMLWVSKNFNQKTMLETFKLLNDFCYAILESSIAVRREIHHQ